MKKTITLTFFTIFSISLSFSQNHAPTAIDDYAVTTRGYMKVDVLANDFDIDGNDLSVFHFSIKKPKHGYIFRVIDDLYEYHAYPSYTGGYDTMMYLLRDNGSPTMLDTGTLVILVDNPLTFDSVSVNNIKAGANADGFLFGERRKYYNGVTNNFLPLFEVPKGSNINSIFSGNIWIAGLDDLDTLHVAAQRYLADGNDFWAGPVSSVYDSLYDYKFNRVWKMTRNEIEDHLVQCCPAGYVPSQNILDWPGNGDVSLGQSSIIAPFYDWNQDGIYDPYNGDFPEIRGDEAVFFVFNDDRYTHTESGGNKFGVEVRGMLYEVNCPDDSALWNTVFLHFDLVNRSSNNYDSVYLGVFMDLDLGYPWDDYIGCDVQRGSFYEYNGNDYDIPISDVNGYGANPPAQSVTFLAGPYMENDGIDNTDGLCDEGLNGFNFGDDITDNERFGLRKFMATISNGVYYPIDDPVLPTFYYNIMRGLWNDSEPLHYWGNGYPNAGGTGPVCSFMFPGNSDTCNWGTLGIDPGGNAPWTDFQAGNQPGDRRGIGSSGPFIFNQGQTQELDLAFVFGRNFLDYKATSAIPVMQERIDSIISYFRKGATPCGGFTLKQQETQTLNIYPNPAIDYINIVYTPAINSIYEVFDVQGNKRFSGTLYPLGSQQLNISALQNGLYFLRVINGKSSISGKFIKY
jgi:hypothetical protein